MSIHRPFGSLVPYGDPTWYQGWHSPYYNESHVQLRTYVRNWVEKWITPNAHEWDEQKSIPKEVFVEFAKSGLANTVCGPILKPEDITYPLPCGLTANSFDVFHELIIVDEFSRAGSGGVVWSLFGGLSIGLPPVMLFANKQLRDKVVKPCLAGDKVICLAITEPTAGSDVAALKCTAVLNASKTHYVVNGIKKWITNGVYADFFTVACRTGKPDSGMSGLSLLLIEKSMKGVTPRQMKCSGVWPSGTSIISFDNVMVPVSNLIGKENEGFKYIMTNFNHERWSICVQATRFARVCLEEAMIHAQRRETFGKKLIEHPVIRNKLAHMARHVEATQAMLESVAFQLTRMSKAEATNRLAGPIALLKAQSTTTFELCAREASQIFGGLSYTRGGLGEKVERLYREVRAYAIPGGSEEIMLDLGIRQSVKSAEENKKKSKL
jgi:alkylation response protein AidB-like acyl-CoA dehydrogenase